MSKSKANDAHLYRGVSDVGDRINGGMIIPAGIEGEVTARYDGLISYDGKFQYGPSTDNTARAHQINTGTYGARCVSTSRSKMVAADFASNFGRVIGWVYVIDEARLAQFGIIAKEFIDPLYDEAEVTLILPNEDPLPQELIVKKYRVDSSGDPVDEY